MQKEIAATIGFFDGVHSGHRFLIQQLKDLADSEGLPSAVITFKQHPQSILRPKSAPKLLCTLEEKVNILFSLNVDFCYVIDFTLGLSRFDARTFISDILRKELNVKQLLIGYDHRFGRNRKDDFSHYALYGEVCGMNVVQALEMQDSSLRISSTWIRKELMENRIEEANRLLSYNYSLEGKVIDGNKLGRKIGFPTANLEINDENKVIPKNGIYAVWTHIGTKKYQGMAYIGKRPTFISSGEERIEVHILNFSSNIYGKTIRLEFVKFLRGDKMFNGLSELKEQLSVDRENTKEALSSL